MSSAPTRRNAILGYTGFVGQSLLASTEWEQLHASDSVQVDLYNSSNIEQLAGQSYDLVICAACPAQKWLANKEPENDWRNIERLIKAVDSIGEVRERFVLISTIDVYIDPSQPLDETFPCGESIETHHAYGKHRFRFEEFVRTRFPGRHVVVRLPGLFGALLKKNYLFDLLNDNNVGTVQPNTWFQWYDMSGLASDLRTLVNAGDNAPQLVNLFPPPVRTADIVERFFPEQRDRVKQSFNDADSIKYALRTVRCRGLFDGATDEYYCSEEQLWRQLEAFVAEYRRKQSK